MEGKHCDICEKQIADSNLCKACLKAYKKAKEQIKRELAYA